MRKLFTLVVIALTFGCTSSNQTYISYSPAFKVGIPSNDLKLATVFLADGISIKFSDNSLLSGLLITKELESLSSEFNLHDYPEYILGIKALSDLSESEVNLFSNSAKEIQYTYDEQNVIQYRDEDKVNYIICGNGSCLSFIVKKDNEDQILMMTGINILKEKFIKIVKGI